MIATYLTLATGLSSNALAQDVDLEQTNSENTIQAGQEVTGLEQWCSDNTVQVDLNGAPWRYVAKELLGFDDYGIGLEAISDPRNPQIAAPLQAPDGDVYLANVKCGDKEAVDESDTVHVDLIYENFVEEDPEVTGWINNEGPDNIFLDVYGKGDTIFVPKHYFDAAPEEVQDLVADGDLTKEELEDVLKNYYTKEEINAFVNDLHVGIINNTTNITNLENRVIVLEENPNTGVMRAEVFPNTRNPFNLSRRSFGAQLAYVQTSFDTTFQYEDAENKEVRNIERRPTLALNVSAPLVGIKLAEDGELRPFIMYNGDFALVDGSFTKDTKGNYSGNMIRQDLLAGLDFVTTDGRFELGLAAGAVMAYLANTKSLMEVDGIKTTEDFEGDGLRLTLQGRSPFLLARYNYMALTEDLDLTTRVPNIGTHQGEATVKEKTHELTLGVPVELGDWTVMPRATGLVSEFDLKGDGEVLADQEWERARLDFGGQVFWQPTDKLRFNLGADWAWKDEYDTERDQVQHIDANKTVTLETGVELTF
tara:strand:+ start:2396 stop:4003 length:1608 start_codon:yes stop_codon:yes gene_type:complete